MPVEPNEMLKINSVLSRESELFIGSSLGCIHISEKEILIKEKCASVGENPLISSNLVKIAEITSSIGIY